MISTGRVEDGIQEVSNLANYKIKEKINGKLILSEGNRAKLDLNLDEIQVSVLGDVVQTAKNQPASGRTDSKADEQDRRDRSRV